MNKPITRDTIISTRKDLLASALSPTEIVMLNMEHGTYFGLEQTAKAIWEQLDQPRAVANLCAELGQIYQVDQATCLHDVLIFLGELRKDGLIHVHERTPAA